MARVAYGMALASDRVRAEIVDWEDFKDMGKKYRVSVVPKTFFDYDASFSGTLPEADILERLLEESR